MRLGRPLAAGAAACVIAAAAGCSWLPPRAGMGEFIDDASITSQVQSRLVDNREVDINAIKVQTVNGEVLLSGFARNALEKSTAESVAMKVRGVKIVRNEILIRP